MLAGLVVRAQSGFFTVETPDGQIVCRLRGKLKRGRPTGDIAAIGDRVTITRIDDQTGVIEEVEPRSRLISRQSPTPRGVYEQVLIANPDQAVFVFACANPEPRLRMLDRFLITAERHQIPVLIVVNKVDLTGLDEAKQLFAVYPTLGYGMIFTSTKTGHGLEELKTALSGKISALTGPSGVGKSSLLNSLYPGLGLLTRQVSQTSGKGQHTTVAPQLYPLPGGGFVADTPGIKALALYDIDAEELDAYFPEMRDRISDCQFNDCTHTHEPGCAILAGVENGEIDPSRYDSYQRIRRGDEENPA